MGSGGGAPVDKDQQIKNERARAAAYQKIRASGGKEGWNANPYGADNWVKPEGWDQKSEADHEKWFASWDAMAAGQAKDIAAQSAANPPPPATKDLTDQLLQKTRTSFAQRLQIGKNRSNSMNGAQLGGFDLGKPVLGGY